MRWDSRLTSGIQITAIKDLNHRITKFFFGRISTLNNAAKIIISVISNSSRFHSKFTSD